MRPRPPRGPLLPVPSAHTVRYTAALLRSGLRSAHSQPALTAACVRSRSSGAAFPCPFTPGGGSAHISSLRTRTLFGDAATPNRWMAWKGEARADGSRVRTRMSPGEAG